MAGTQKKNAKGRLDRYYYLAKEKGYRARSSFKILQINEKYGHFLEQSKVVIDLCAAPGSWCQVASQLCPVNSLIIGVDIVPIKPMPNCITFQSDITTEDCRSRLRGHMKTWKADTVLHDGAPNVGLGWIQDAYTQSHLTLQALRLAVENLSPGGTFVTKVFRSRDYNNLIWVLKQLFDKVEATKPPASRNVSAEIFVVCKGFKAPKKLDPRLLDPKEVFEELPDGPINNEAKVFNPEIKKRKRDGYDEGDYTLFHPMDLLDWVKQEDEVINTLGGVSMFTIDKELSEWKILKKLKETTKEFYECCKDLKVLGKKDFRMLIKWRKHARTSLGLIDEKDKEVAKIEIEELTEDQQIDKELDELKEKQRLKNKREKRKNNLIKQNEINRLQMNMLTDMQIGIDAGQIGSESLFNLKLAEKTGELNKLAKGKKSMIFTGEDLITDVDIMVDDEHKFKEIESGDELDNLEDQLNDMYENYKQEKIERDSRLKAKEGRGGNDEEWDGIKEPEQESAHSSDDGEFDDDDDDSEIDSSDDEKIDELIKSIDKKKQVDGLSNKAASFFNDDIFKGIELTTTTTTTEPEVVPKVKKSKKSQSKEEKEQVFSDSSDDDESKSSNTFEMVPNDYSKTTSDNDEFETDSEDERANKKTISHKEDVDIATVSAMTLAHQLALGQKTKKDLIEDSFNRYSFREKEGLPSWFIEDEDKHSSIQKPITKEAALALKEKLKQLNARPIKKVMEAQGRKKLRAIKRLEKLKKKSDLIADDSSKSELDKAHEIQAMMGKVKKPKSKPKTTLVVAHGSNKGIGGRPKGVRGKYKMVDGVLKNEMRALKRIEKKHKKKKSH
ncbi:hypothetical protein CANARDRAFT_28964 [[Candida] arabinofermentans NRRL YB-2248]|uniref:Uncharacterized protein n=1 Tax=[Candida] arabinofermentans NRRL YB-2248 TaxID=983967 RepID=A0A1E4SZA3_9ASCO|nr:hypothetical protein CANARDRAFT_28964 [[Candida] arabinofermentans NRRL YB-2248]